VHGEEVPEAEERQAAGSASSPPDYNNLQMPSCHSAQAARINLNRVTVVSVERITIITPHSLFLSILATMFARVATRENIARLDVVCLDHAITLSPYSSVTLYWSLLRPCYPNIVHCHLCFSNLTVVYHGPIAVCSTSPFPNASPFT
jgi:hypothetical protein